LIARSACAIKTWVEVAKDSATWEVAKPNWKTKPWAAATTGPCRAACLAMKVKQKTLPQFRAIMTPAVTMKLRNTRTSTCHRKPPLLVPSSPRPLAPDNPKTNNMAPQA